MKHQETFLRCHLCTRSGSSGSVNNELLDPCPQFLITDPRLRILKKYPDSYYFFKDAMKQKNLNPLPTALLPPPYPTALGLIGPTKKDET